MERFVAKGIVSVFHKPKPLSELNLLKELSPLSRNQSMTKLCLTCGRSNHDRAAYCKKCNSPLEHALRLDAPHPARYFLIGAGVVLVLILIVALLNIFMPLHL